MDGSMPSSPHPELTCIPDIFSGGWGSDSHRGDTSLGTMRPAWRERMAENGARQE